MMLAICVMFLSFFPSALPLPSASPDDWTKTFNLERTAKLRVDTSDANIHVTSCDCTAIVARVTTVGWRIGGDGVNIVDRQDGSVPGRTIATGQCAACRTGATGASILNSKCRELPISICIPATGM